MKSGGNIWWYRQLGKKAIKVLDDPSFACVVLGEPSFECAVLGDPSFECIAKRTETRYIHYFLLL